MFDPTKIKQGFFTNILRAFSDLDASIIKQAELRKKESQLLPLLYFTCLIMLLSQLIQVTSKVQEAPYLSIVTGVVVSYLFFSPYIYICPKCSFSFGFKNVWIYVLELSN